MSVYGSFTAGRAGAQAGLIDTVHGARPGPSLNSGAAQAPHGASLGGRGRRAYPCSDWKHPELELLEMEVARRVSQELPPEKRKEVRVLANRLPTQKTHLEL